MSAPLQNSIVFVLALTVDFIFGELPRPIHPVVWMGKVISPMQRCALQQGKSAQCISGVALVIGTLALFVFPLAVCLKSIPLHVYILVGTFFLTSTFSIKEMQQVAGTIKGLLEKGELKKAQVETTSLVSRDTSTLDEQHLVSATVESVAENLCDSIVAPLFYFLLFGIPGAMAYRVVNTFDAMIGYHGKYEYIGKFSARLDDAVNYIPARISGLLLVLAAYLYRKDGKNAWNIMIRDHRNTESPNAGWSMSAMAGALRTQLKKVGCYSLGDSDEPLSIQLIEYGMTLVNISTLLWIGMCLIVEAVYVFGA